MTLRARLYHNYVEGHLRNSRDFSSSMLTKQVAAGRRLYERLLPTDRDAAILELGCGYGEFLMLLRSLGYRNIFGIDVSSQQIEQAQNFGLQEVSQTDVFEHLATKTDAYDCIVANDFLEHFSKDEVMKLLDEVFRALKPEGRFLFRVPNGGSIFAGRLRYGDFTHEVSFTESSVRQVLSASGFSAIEVLPVRPMTQGPKGMVRAIAWGCIEIVLRTYLLIETGRFGKAVLTQNLIGLGRKENLVNRS